MKKFLLSLLFLPTLVFGQAAPLYTTPVVVTNIASAPDLAGKIIYVAPWGNDATANGSYLKPYKYVHNPIEVDAATPSWSGANKIAVAGDTIILTADVHTQHSIIPLKDGVNLLIMPGATIIRAETFENALVDGAPAAFASDLNTAGPLIQPGSNSVVTAWGATIITTNDVDSNFDAGYGWFEGLNTWGDFTFISWTNRSTLNSSLFGGRFIGSSDNIYMTTAVVAERTALITGANMRNGWDGIRASGFLRLTTAQLYINSTNTSSSGGDQSRGVVISGGVRWIDTGSYITTGGGDVANYGVAADGATTTAALNGTTIKVIGSGTPVELTTSATATGVYLANESPVVKSGATSGYVLTSDAIGIGTWQAAAGSSLWVLNEDSGPGGVDVLNPLNDVPAIGSAMGEFNVVSADALKLYFGGGTLSTTIDGTGMFIEQQVKISTLSGSGTKAVFADNDGILTPASGAVQPLGTVFSIPVTAVDLTTTGDTLVFNVAAESGFIMTSAAVYITATDTLTVPAQVKIKATEGDLSATTTLTGTVLNRYATIYPSALTAFFASSGSSIEIEVTVGATAVQCEATVVVTGYYLAQ